MAIENVFGGAFASLDQRLEQLARSLAAGVPTAAAADPREEVLVRYTVGQGSFSADGKFSVLRMRMFKLNGEEDGTHDGVWEPVITPGDLTAPVPQPDGVFDQAAGPVPRTPVAAWTKAVWTFGDGSSIVGVGPASQRLERLADGAHLFHVAVAGIISGGTGRYEGAQGVKTALGATLVPAGVDMFALPPGARFGAVTVEVFRVVRAHDIGTGGGEEAGGGAAGGGGAGATGGSPGGGREGGGAAAGGGSAGGEGSAEGGAKPRPRPAPDGARRAGAGGKSGGGKSGGGKTGGGKTGGGRGSRGSGPGGGEEGGG
jgi:hypothetical protein